MADLEAALELQRDGQGWTATVPEGWAQGRTTFGGLVAGYLVRAAEQVQARPIRSTDVYFLEPVVPGPIGLRVESVREGKHLTHLGVVLEQAGKPAAIGRFLLADIGIGPFDNVPAAPVPERALADSLEVPHMDGLMPQFLANLRVRYGEGEVPMSASDRAVGGGFVCNLGPARGVAALMSHIDAWPPPILAMVDRPAVASSVRWHVQFHADVQAADGQQWSWFRGEAQWRSGPLSTVTGMLVRDGVPVAYSEQSQVMYL